MRKPRPVESHTFAGMETAVSQQAQAAGEYTAETLTAKLLEPRPSINAAAGRMEQDAPLFYGVIQPTLF
jgi:hypothetical protein